MEKATLNEQQKAILLYLYHEGPRKLHEVALFLNLLECWESGSTNTRGTVGVPGRLTSVTEILDRVLTDASTTPDGGSNTFQGRLIRISSRSKKADSVEFTLTASFDFQTAYRLSVGVSGLLGKIATEGAGYSLMILPEELPTT